MSPITHFLVGWSAGAAARLRGRDLGLVAWAGVLPDLDGAGALVDLAMQAAGRYSEFYAAYHRVLLHGLFGAVLIAATLAGFAERRRAVFLFSLVSVHLHFLGDLLGSRGADPGELWPISYLQPFSSAVRFIWAGQWPLDAWPNIALTVLLLAWGFYVGVRDGHTPLGAINRRADLAVVETLRARFRRV